MIDGGDQAAAFRAAADRGGREAPAPNYAAIRSIPDQLGVMRATVEVHAPRGPVADFWRGSALRILEGAQLVLGILAQFTPAPGPVRAPQQVTAPIGPGVERPVPRWPGHDPRLPPGDPHP